MSEKGHSRTYSVRGSRDGPATADTNGLSDRQTEILVATVDAWHANAPGPAHQPLRSAAEGYPALHLNWPAAIRVATREELRPLTQADWLVADRSQGPDWVLSPSEATLTAFGDATAAAITEGLMDPDRRLRLILEAIVDAYATDPSTTLTLTPYQQVNLITSGPWPLARDVARPQDFTLLQDAGLLRVIPVGKGLDVVPTAPGRDVVNRALDSPENTGCPFTSSTSTGPGP